MQDAKNRHLGTIAQICWAISSQLRHVSTIGKNLLNSNISPTSSQYGELRSTSVWDPLASLGCPNKFQWLSLLRSVTARHSSSGRQPNFAVLNRGRHLYSAGRPARWALAQISRKFRTCVFYIFGKCLIHIVRCFPVFIAFFCNCHPVVGWIMILTRHKASTSICWHFEFAYVVIATKPVHRLQIHPILLNYRAPQPFPKLHPGPCSVGIWPRTYRHADRHTHTHTHTQTAVTNIHFAPSTTHVKCN